MTFGTISHTHLLIVEHNAATRQAFISNYKKSELPIKYSFIDTAAQLPNKLKSVKYDAVIISYDPRISDYSAVIKSIGNVRTLFLVHPRDEESFIKSVPGENRYVLKDAKNNYAIDILLLVQKTKLKPTGFSYEEMFNLILDKILIGIIIIDSNRSIKFINKKINLISCQ